MVTSPQQNDRIYKLLLIIGLIVGVGLLLLFPTAKPLWTDEVYDIKTGYHSLTDIFRGAANSRDHTLFQAIAPWITRHTFGDSVFWYRFFSALPAAFVPWFVYLIGLRINRTVALLGVWLVALSPGMILFARMARYHGMLAFLATVSTYLLIRLLERGRWRELVAYTLVTLAMLWVYIPSLFLVVGQGLGVLLLYRREAHSIKALIGIALAVAGITPIVLMGTDATHVVQSASTVRVESSEIGGGMGGLVNRLILPVYVFCVGETVYPWTWWASVGGGLTALGCFFYGAKRLQGRRELLIPLSCTVAVLLFAIVTSGKLGAMQTVGSMAKRDTFCLPLFCITVAIGLAGIPERRWRYGRQRFCWGSGATRR